MRHPNSNASRFKPTLDRNGHLKLARDKVTLQAEIVARLAASHAAKSRLLIELQTSAKCVNAALAQLEVEGRVESFIRKSSRGRLDVYWCLPGQSPHAIARGFNGAKILAAFQKVAAARLARA